MGKVRERLFLVKGIFQLAFGIPTFAVGKPSATYDCDDAALDMVKQCEEEDFEYIIIVGNPKVKNVSCLKCTHVWILVVIDDESYAYDWGHYKYDKQHYEGFTITKEELLKAVELDKEVI